MSKFDFIDQIKELEAAAAGLTVDKNLFVGTGICESEIALELIELNGISLYLFRKNEYLINTDKDIKNIFNSLETADKKAMENFTNICGFDVYHYFYK